MTKLFSGAKYRVQRGDMLLEALVGLVLLSILGLGLTYAAARVLAQQRYANTQDIALRQMRHTLETQGIAALCESGSSELQLATQAQTFQMTATVQCSSHAVKVTVAGDLPAINAPITNVVTEMRFATSAQEAQAVQLLGEGSLVIQQ